MYQSLYENLLKRISIVAFICGLSSLVFYILHDYIGGLYYPGYDRMSQAVSDLTALDAPSYAISRSYSSIYGIFCIACCLLLCLAFGKAHKLLKLGVICCTVMQLVSAVGYSLFPLTGSGYDGSTGSFIHVYVLTVAVVALSILSLVLIAIGSFKDRLKLLGILAIIALACMFFGAAGSGSIAHEYFGIVERFSTYSAVAFTAVLAVFALFKNAAKKNS